MLVRLLCLIAAVTAIGAAAPVRVLVSSCGNRARHIRTVLDAAGRFTTRVNEEPGVLTSKVLRAYDVLVSDCPPARAPIPQVRIQPTSSPTPRGFERLHGSPRTARVELGDTTLQTPAAVGVLAQAVEWAATGNVTIPATLSLDPKNADAIRALIVTGGHDYEPSFDSVFDGLPWLRATVDPHPKAFNGDLRKRYDVLVLYDMISDLSDRQRKNLVDFAEAGKGIVVMHHALAGHPNWMWWREMAGAQYVDKSTYLHDRDFVGTPSANRHPVLEGVPELHLHDETYNHMWFAPDNTILLATTDETADGPLAWISGYARSRVVAIQPGHNRESHIHPGYRRLVHNAIRWAAAR